MNSVYNKIDLNRTFSCSISIAEDLTAAWPSKGNPCLYLLFNCKDIYKCRAILTLSSANTWKTITAKYLR